MRVTVVVDQVTKNLTAHDIAAERVLTQGGRSATGLLYEEWFRAAGISSANRIVSNNLMAIIGMTVSGLGVAHLPQSCLQPMLDLGMLEGLQVSPPLPDVGFAVARRADRHSTVIDMLVETARDACDFGQAFQPGEQPAEGSSQPSKPDNQAPRTTDLRRIHARKKTVQPLAP